MTYFIEVYRPSYPHKGVRYKIHKALDRDLLQPTMTCVLQVDNVDNRESVLGVALECAAGKPVTVHKVLG